MTSNRCLSDESLRLLLLGELSAAEAAPLEEHLSQCPACASRTSAWRSANRVAAAQPQTTGPKASADQNGLLDDLGPADPSHLPTHSSLFDDTQALSMPAKTAAQELLARLEPAAGPDELGRLGGFRLLQLLGQGGMGAVFLAEDVRLRRRVALKLLRPDQAAQPDAALRFLREARSAAAVRHDHVVTIYQVGEANGLPFIAQELLEGESLDERLKRERRLPVREALRIGREIAAGLSAAHAQGTLHRDVKPGNVFLAGPPGEECVAVSGTETTATLATPAATAEPRTKLLDFGLARSQQGDEQLTHTGAVLGTPAYMSPEQAQGQAVDARSDLFSLGGVLYRMVTGRLPFPGTDVLSILRSLAVDEPPSARSLNPEVPVERSNLIADLLQKDRRQRPASAAAVHARLAAIEAGLGQPRAQQSRSALRRPLVAALAAGLLISLGIFLYARMPKNGDVKPQPKATAAQQAATPPAKPIFEHDFTSNEPRWIADDASKEVSIQGGRFVMELSDGFFHWVGETPELAEADFEVLGRAPRGMWGVSAWTPRFPKVAFTLGLGYDGELSAWRTTQATQDATSESTLLLLRRPVANWQMDGMNVLRATIRDGRAWVWVNGQETGPPIELPDPIPQSKINLLGYVDDAGSRCEFDSLRIWRPGEGPPPQLVQLPPRTPVAKPFFEHDFSDDDPPWLDEKVDLLAVRDGRFTMDNAGPNVWCFSSAVPALETADIEIPGRATDGCWGVFLTAQTFPKYGVAIALDREGRLTAWRSVQGQVETSPELTPLKIRTKSLTRWKADGFNLLRVCVAAGTAKVWVNGQVACELLELPDPLPLFKTWLIGGRGEGELHCQFESIRVWRAGQGPPPELGGTPGKPFFELDFINNPPEFLERDKSRLKLQDGRLAMHADRQWLWYHGSPETGSADVEVSVRPITGQWGVAAWTSGPDFPAVGLFLVLDGEGKLSVGHQNQPNAETPFSIDWPEIRRKPLERWKKDGFNTLRTTIRAGRAFVWVNGQEACEPIELPAPLPRFGVGFFGGNSENAHGEFDWIRVWRAGLRDWPTSSATR